MTKIPIAMPPTLTLLLPVCMYLKTWTKYTKALA